MISVDNVASGEAIGSTTNTVALTCSAGTTVLVVGIVIAGGSNAPTGITYDGVAMTNRTSLSTFLGGAKMQVWTLSNPTTGSSKNIVATFSVANTSHLVGISLLGADASNPVDATATLQNIDTSITTVKGGSLVLNFCRVYRNSGSDSPVVAHSETERLNTAIFSSSNIFFAAATLATGLPGSKSTGWSIGSQDANESVIVVISIAPEATSRTVTAKARVKQAGVTKTATSKARLRQLGVTKTIRAGATVKKIGITKTITARGKIGTTITRSISAKANIVLPPRGHWRLRSKDDTYPVAMKDDRIKL